MIYLKPASCHPDHLRFFLQVEPVRFYKTTHKSKYIKTPELERYLQYKKAMWAEWYQTGMTFPEADSHITFGIPIPASWPKYRKQQMDGQPHRGKKDESLKKDTDNLVKALLDSLHNVDDSHIWDYHATKLWTNGPGYIIVEIPSIEGYI